MIITVIIIIFTFNLSFIYFFIVINAKKLILNKYLTLALTLAYKDNFSIPLLIVKNSTKLYFL